MTISPTPLLQIQGATVLKNGARLLDNLTLDIAEGQHTAILGPNGSGKSSLIKLITRQHYALAPDDGHSPMTIFGRDRWDVFELRALLGIVSADLHQAFMGDETMPGLEVVLSGFFASQGLARHHTVTPAMREQAQEALARMEAAHLAHRPIVTLSTGEARRVLIARALVSNPRALLVDEPTTGLDLVARRRFLETLRQIARHGQTVVLVTHHVEEIIPEIARVILMREGRVFQDGPKEELLTSPILSALFGAPIQVRQDSDYYEAHMADATGDNM